MSKFEMPGMFNRVRAEAPGSTDSTQAANDRLPPPPPVQPSPHYDMIDPQVIALSDVVNALKSLPDKRSQAILLLYVTLRFELVEHLTEFIKEQQGVTDHRNNQEPV